MAILKLNMRQRLFIEALLTNVRAKGKEPRSYTLYEIYKKVHIEEREKYVIEFPDGTARLINHAINSAEPIEVDFEKAELRELHSLVDGFEGISPPEMEWWDPLWKQLESAVKD
jgi:hypothetical protein